MNNYRTIPKDRKVKMHGSILKWVLYGILVIALGVVTAAVFYEIHTSKLQAQELSEYATSLTYDIEDGPSEKIIFPEKGPFDTRLGYAQLPQLLDRVSSRGMEIKQQARFSQGLIDYTSKGFFVPYQEKYQAGLEIRDSQGKPIYSFSYPRRVYSEFDSVPSLIVQSLLFIENRELLDEERPFMNPAIDWVRFTKASMHEAAKKIGFNYKTIGGSTLSTQIEKYRHSPEGITVDPEEKIRQMVSASVRAYQKGPATLPARKDVVLSYVNTVPLSGAPGYGEVHGIGDGLWVWFGVDFRDVNKILQVQDAKGDTLRAQGQALRQVMSLMIAQRRPSYYLGAQGCNELNKLTGSYLRLLANDGYISPALRDAGLAQEVTFRDFNNYPAVEPTETDKGALMARTHLSNMLGKTLYDLDRLDLSATTTLQNDLQKKVSEYLTKLNDPDFAQSVGVFGERMLSPSGTDEVRYSFTLFEHTPYGNLVRVQTDNTDQPFDINEGSKLELGSTAKLRVLVTYLEMIAEVHQRYEGKTAEEIRAALAEQNDNLTQFVLWHLLKSEDKSLEGTLYQSLQRRYSANPNEVFFTGGGLHTFRNFKDEDNYSNPTIQEAFLKSINLPFVRLMRDVVRYSIYQNIGSIEKLMGNDNNPERQKYLAQFADREGRTYLFRFWRKYKDKTEEERFEALLDGLRQDEVRLSVVHRFLYPETDSTSFKKFLRERLPEQKLKPERLTELYNGYGPKAYNLPDQGYLARVHPLELWFLSYMRQHPEAKWSEVVEASKDERQEVYKWLFRTKYKSARDSRIRTIIEIEAFHNIQDRWNRLGYPFDHLVPSLATALGSSGDRPEALAELMGIIVNDGVRHRTRRIGKLHFASQTPYETALDWQPDSGKQVLDPVVAKTVKSMLVEVVDAGTARRLQGGFTRADGTPMVMGGKTGTGDNRHVTISSTGQRITSRAVNRTATFVFMLGDRHFGTLTAFVPGREAAGFHFTSSLPVQVLKGMAPILEPYLNPASKTDSLATPNVEQQIAVKKRGKETPVVAVSDSKQTAAALSKPQQNTLQMVQKN